MAGTHDSLPGLDVEYAAAGAVGCDRRPDPGRWRQSGHPQPRRQIPRVSRDFLGQGAANSSAGLIGGIPAGGSISGTVLVMSAGAKSRWTNIFGGLFVALIVLAAAPLVEMVPMPGLAALLIVAGFQGLRVEAAIDVWRAGKLHAAAMIATFAATLLVPLQDAVLIGMALSILLHVFHEANRVAITQIVPVRGGLPEERPAPEVVPSNELTILQVNGSLFFAGAKYSGVTRGSEIPSGR